MGELELVWLLSSGSEPFTLCGHGQKPVGLVSVFLIAGSGRAIKLSGVLLILFLS